MMMLRDAPLIIAPYVYVLPGCQFDEERNDLSSRPAGHVVALRVRASIPLTRRDDCFRRTTRFLHVYQFALRQQDKAESHFFISLAIRADARRWSPILRAAYNSHKAHQTAMLPFSPLTRDLIRILNENYTQDNFQDFSLFGRLLQLAE